MCTVRSNSSNCSSFHVVLIRQIARDAGLHITVHAGESGPPEHVKEVSMQLIMYHTAGNFNGFDFWKFEYYRK